MVEPDDVSYKGKASIMDTQLMSHRKAHSAFSMNMDKQVNKGDQETASQRRISSLFSLGSYKDNVSTLNNNKRIDDFLDTNSLTDLSMADDDDSLSVSSDSDSDSSDSSSTDVTSINTSSISLTETLASRATGMSKIYTIAGSEADSGSNDSDSNGSSSSNSSYSDEHGGNKVVYDNRVTIPSSGIRAVPQHLHEPLSSAMQGLQRHEAQEVIGHVSALRSLIDDMKQIKKEGHKEDAALIQETALAVKNEDEEKKESGDATPFDENEKVSAEEETAPRSALLDSISSYLAKDDESVASTSDSGDSSISSTTDSNASSVVIRNATRVTPGQNRITDPMTMTTSTGNRAKPGDIQPKGTLKYTDNIAVETPTKPARPSKFSLDDLLQSHKKK